MVGRLALDQVVKVRILAQQPLEPAAGRRDLAGLAAALLTVGLLAACGSASTAVVAPAGPKLARLVDGRLDSTNPAGDGAYLAWTSGNRSFDMTVTEQGNVLVRRGPERPRRVNPAGTEGISGGVDGNRLVYQELGKGSHIRLYDLGRRRFVALPRSVADPPAGIVWKPSISGRWLLFGRIAYGWDILLDNLDTGRTRLLESNRRHAGYSVPGQVDGRWAVWLSCAENACDVFEFDTRTGTRRRVPVVGIDLRRIQGPSVARDGTVYFGDGGKPCGAGMALYRYRPGGRVERLVTLPTGTDFQYSYAENVTGGIRVLLDTFDCRTGHATISGVVDPAG